MLEDISCVYCEHWKHAKIKRKEEVVESPGKGKKLKKKRKTYQIITKKCSAGNKKRSVTLESKACKYFKPTKIFYCDKNNHFIDPVQCINRRRNDKGLKDWEACKKCHQFRDIINIVQDYYFDLVPVLDPPTKTKRKIKRRKTVEKPKRKIKRRKIEKPKRTIKRRKPKTKRKIKRRKK